MVEKKWCEAKKLKQQIDNEMLKTAKMEKTTKTAEMANISLAIPNPKVEKEGRKLQKRGMQ